LVGVTDTAVKLIQQPLGIPDDHPDPLLWLLESGCPREELELKLQEADSAAFEYGTLSSPIRRPQKIIAAPVNYRDHQVEMSEQSSISDYGVFLKANSSITGPNGIVELPYTDRRIDQEGELGIVIGSRGRHIPAADAMHYVFGYCCLLDVSVRSTEDRSTRKSFDSFTPIGPWITTRDEVPDPSGLQLECWVNGELRQKASTSELIFDVPLLIEYASSVMTLEPGDIIATGTPAGVGSLADGDHVRVAIERLGELHISVDGSKAIPYASRPGL